MSSDPTTTTSVVVLDVLDNAWDPLLARTEGLSADEYEWEPAAGCWTVRPQADGSWVADWQDPDPEPAPVTTIAWRCWHIAVDCLDGYSSTAFGETGTGLTGGQWVAGWPEAGEMLSRSWAVFRAGVARWRDDELLDPLGPTWGVYGELTKLHLALHAAREVIHHGAEIALLRDLYAAR